MSKSLGAGTFSASVLVFLMAPEMTLSQPTVQITQNGFVPENPAYPYAGHRYNFDTYPGDNDMPWLREYVADQNIFAKIDMNAPWLDREFEMMKAIVRFTSHTLSWSDEQTVESLLRGRDVLIAAEENPEYTWLCGKISGVAVALAQAHGIPARFLNALSEYTPFGGDTACEFYSTRYDRWVFMDPKTNAWIEHETDGPLGAAELHHYYLAGQIDAEEIGGVWIAKPSPPLVFMPSPVNRAPIAPFSSIRWWDGYWRYMSVSYKTHPNGQYPACCGNPRIAYICNDQWYNDFKRIMPPFPVLPLDDPNISYPLNNIEAAAMFSGADVLISLKNNMTDFVRYETRQSDGQGGFSEWAPISLPLVGLLKKSYQWRPTTTTTLQIRGVTLAGVQSREVIITYVPDLDSDDDGVLDPDDECPFNRAGLPVDAKGRPRCDVNHDCLVDGQDVQTLIADLLLD